MTVAEIPVPLADPPAPAAGGASRRPYSPPRLRHLGSVRELTLGGTAGMAEGGGTFRAAM
jgi:hypothetical protein